MRMKHTHLCCPCASKRGFRSTLSYGIIIGGVLARLIRTPSTRLKTCADCKRKFRDIYRLNNV